MKIDPLEMLSQNEHKIGHGVEEVLDAAGNAITSETKKTKIWTSFGTKMKLAASVLSVSFHKCKYYCISIHYLSCLYNLNLNLLCI